jgi:hypothetical protein
MIADVLFAISEIIMCRFFFVALRPNAGHGLLIFEVSRSQTTTHHSWQDSSGRVISSSQRPLVHNTQHSQQTNIHAPGGIRDHDLSRRADCAEIVPPKYEKPSVYLLEIKHAGDVNRSRP